MIYGLPRELTVNGKKWKIRTDFRDIMTIVFALNDPNLQDNEKAYVLLYIMYEDFEDMGKDDYEEAFKQATDFINHGNNGSKKGKEAKMIDFEQDENLLIPAINRVAGFEIRDCEYMHWWTFMGYFMEIGDCMYSQILSIRSKRAHGEKLENWEMKFFAKNKDIIMIKDKLSDEEKAEMELVNKLLG